MMNWLPIVLIAAAVVCGAAGAAQAGTPVDSPSQAYQEMIARSLMNRGNNFRLKAVIEKAKRGEDVTIAFIGGSITEGAGANPQQTNCYAYLTYERFKEMLAPGGGNVHFIKAGVGGTPSQLGVIRYERDVLRDGTVQPDLVVVEFAVNDWDDETQGVCYESLVLKILEAENQPAVILLFNVFENDWNLQDRLAPVGWHYDLPMVSVKDAVVPQFRLSRDQGNVITKAEFFADQYHPTNAGHRIIADCLAYLLAEVAQADPDEGDIDLNKPPKIGDAFKNIKLLDRKENTAAAQIDPGGFSQTDLDVQRALFDTNLAGTPLFPNNWMHSAKSGSESFKMKITSKSLMLIFKDSWNQQFGRAEVYVDGKYVKTLDPHIINWTHCHPTLVYWEEEAREHEIEIRMAPGDEGKSFTILGFGYVE